MKVYPPTLEAEMLKAKSPKAHNNDGIRRRSAKPNGSRSAQVIDRRNGTKAGAGANDLATRPSGNGKNNGKAKIAKRKTDARLAEAARQRDVLLQFVQRRGAAQTLEEIYSVGLDVILKILRCDRAAILIFDNKNTKRFVAWRGLSDRNPATEIHDRSALRISSDPIFRRN
jgi:hypothetical protein